MYPLLSANKGPGVVRIACNASKGDGNYETSVNVDKQRMHSNPQKADSHFEARLGVCVQAVHTGASSSKFLVSTAVGFLYGRPAKTGQNPTVYKFISCGGGGRRVRKNATRFENTTAARGAAGGPRVRYYVA